jgi:Spy/CpxP family protein refolding chaperone
MKYFSIILLSLLFASAFLFAQEDVDIDVQAIPGEGEMMFLDEGDLVQIPNLTDEQQATLRRMSLELKRELLPIRSKLESKRLDYEFVMLEQPPDLNKIYTLIDDISSLRADMQKKRIAHQFKVRDILTDEQKKVWDKMSAHHFPGILGDERRVIKIQKGGEGSDEELQETPQGDKTKHLKRRIEILR